MNIRVFSKENPRLGTVKKANINVPITSFCSFFVSNRERFIVKQIKPKGNEDKSNYFIRLDYLRNRDGRLIQPCVIVIPKASGHIGRAEGEKRTVGYQKANLSNERATGEKRRPISGTAQRSRELRRHLSGCRLHGNPTLHAGRDVPKLLPAESMENRPTHPVKRLRTGRYPGMDRQSVYK